MSGRRADQLSHRDGNGFAGPSGLRKAATHVKFLVISRIPAAAALGTIGPAHAPVVGPLGPPGGKLFSRVADSLHPPELATGGRSRGHVIIQLGTEHVIKVGLTQLCLVDDITLRSDREVANSVHLPLEPFLAAARARSPI